MPLSAQVREGLIEHLRANESASGTADWEQLAKRLGVNRVDLLRSVADLERMPFLDLDGVTPAPDALHSFPESLARRYDSLPLYLNGREITVAVGHPRWTRLDALRRELAAYEVVFVLVDPRALTALIEASYPSAAETEVAAYLGAGELPPQRLEWPAERAPIARIVEAILDRACRQGASDIHLEPGPRHTLVRLRVDGLLHEAFHLDAALHEAIVCRLKVLADLVITDRHRPQDGRFSHTAHGQAVEARLSTLRAAHGEKAVIRLLGQGGHAEWALSRLGMPPALEGQLAQLLAQPHGLLLVTGPTGSGKTSTLYAALSHLATGERNLVSLEDPVEVQLEGVTQVPMRPELDLDFSTALRAVLRQDPDVVMVGEIRDRETAEIALRGSLTGHLLMSTLHANDAAEAVARLIEMGIAAHHVAPALLGVVAQRMVRQLCGCHAYRVASPSELSAFQLPPGLGEVPVPVPRGCAACGGAGFRGRIGVFELLVVDAPIRGLIQERASGDRIREAAVAGGMRPLWRAGLREVLTGRTTLEEILRVVRRPL